MLLKTFCAIQQCWPKQSLKVDGTEQQMVKMMRIIKLMKKTMTKGMMKTK